MCRYHPIETLNFILEKIIEDLQLGKDTNILKVFDEVENLTMILHRIDAIPTCWENIILKFFCSVLEIYTKLIINGPNKNLHVEIVKERFYDFFSLICSQRMLNIPLPRCRDARLQRRSKTRSNC